MTPRLRWASILGYVTVFLVSLGWAAAFAPLDPDSHHDGYILSTAIGVADGLHIHSEISSQYGPVTGLVQGFVLQFMPHTLLSLRYFTALIVALTAVLMVAILRQFGHSWWRASMVALLWVAMSPAWSVMHDLLPLWAWPSTVWFALALSGLLAVLVALRRAQGGQWTGPLIGLGGLLLGLSSITRLNVGAAVTVCLAAALVLARFRLGGSRRRTTFFAVAYIVGITLPLALIAAQGSLADFFEQAIVFPRSVYGGKTDWVNVIITYGLVPAPFALGAGALYWSLRGGRRLSVKRRVLAAASALALVSLAILPIGTRWRMVFANALPQDLHSHLDFQAVMPMYAAVLATVGISACGPFVPGLRRAWSADARWLLLGALALGSLVQLYPLFDVYHLWWCIAPALVLVAAAAPRLPDTRREALFALGVGVPYVLVNLWSAAVEYSYPRTEVTTGVLAGMQFRSEHLLPSGDLDRLLAGLPQQRTLMLCDDGIWSVWNRVYVSATKHAVVWDGVAEPGTEYLAPHRAATFPGADQASAAVVCTDAVRKNDVGEIARELGMHISGHAGVQFTAMPPYTVYRLDRERKR